MDPTEVENFKAVHSYDWEQNAEFQHGLHSILSAARPDQVDVLTNRAKCFYFQKKTNIHVNDAAYQEWLGSTYALGGPPAADREEKKKTESKIDTVGVRDMGASEQDAPFPKSFADVVELIISGKPIPGIKEIPDVVLEAPANAATVPPRKKPWEVAKSIQTA